MVVTGEPVAPSPRWDGTGSGTQLRYGDFVGSVWGCPAGGCGFASNDTTTSFVSRWRGFLDVTSDLAGKTLHFGVYADDAASLTLFDKAGTRYEVINRPPRLGVASWRTTNTVTSPGNRGCDTGVPSLAPLCLLGLGLLGRRR